MVYFSIPFYCVSWYCCICFHVHIWFVQRIVKLYLWRWWLPKSNPKQMNPLKHNPTWRMCTFWYLITKDLPVLKTMLNISQNEMEHVPPFITQVPLLEHSCLNPRKLQIVMPPCLRCNSLTITTPKTETLHGVFKNWLLARPAHVDGIGAHL